MIKLVVVEVNNYLYSLKDDKDNKYSLNLEFINLEKAVSINDILYISENLIKEKNFYTFGAFNNEYGKKIEQGIEEDIIILEQDNKKTYLQKYYG